MDTYEHIIQEIANSKKMVDCETTAWTYDKEAAITLMRFYEELDKQNKKILSQMKPKKESISDITRGMFE